MHGSPPSITASTTLSTFPKLSVLFQRRQQGRQGQFLTNLHNAAITTQLGVEGLDGNHCDNRAATEKTEMTTEEEEEEEWTTTMTTTTTTQSTDDGNTVATMSEDYYLDDNEALELELAEVGAMIAELEVTLHQQQEQQHKQQGEKLTETQQPSSNDNDDNGNDDIIVDYDSQQEMLEMYQQARSSLLLVQKIRQDMEEGFDDNDDTTTLDAGRNVDPLEEEEEEEHDSLSSSSSFNNNNKDMLLNEFHSSIGVEPPASLDEPTFVRHKTSCTTSWNGNDDHDGEESHDHVNELFSEAPSVKNKKKHDDDEVRTLSTTTTTTNNLTTATTPPTTTTPTTTTTFQSLRSTPTTMTKEPLYELCKTTESKDEEEMIMTKTITTTTATTADDGHVPHPPRIPPTKAFLRKVIFGSSSFVHGMGRLPSDITPAGEILECQANSPAGAIFHGVTTNNKDNNQKHHNMIRATPYLQSNPLGRAKPRNNSNHHHHQTVSIEESKFIREEDGGGGEEVVTETEDKNTTTTIATVVGTTQIIPHHQASSSFKKNNMSSNLGYYYNDNKNKNNVIMIRATSYLKSNPWSRAELRNLPHTTTSQMKNKTEPPFGSDIILKQDIAQHDPPKEERISSDGVEEATRKDPLSPSQLPWVPKPIILLDLSCNASIGGSANDERSALPSPGSSSSSNSGRFAGNDEENITMPKTRTTPSHVDLAGSQTQEMDKQNGSTERTGCDRVKAAVKDPLLTSPKKSKTTGVSSDLLLPVALSSTMQKQLPLNGENGARTKVDIEDFVNRAINSRTETATTTAGNVRGESVGEEKSDEPFNWDQEKIDIQQNQGSATSTDISEEEAMKDSVLHSRPSPSQMAKTISELDRMMGAGMTLNSSKDVRIGYLGEEKSDEPLFWDHEKEEMQQNQVSGNSPEIYVEQTMDDPLPSAPQPTEAISRLDGDSANTLPGPPIETPLNESTPYRDPGQREATTPQRPLLMNDPPRLPSSIAKPSGEPEHTASRDAFVPVSVRVKRKAFEVFRKPRHILPADGPSFTTSMDLNGVSRTKPNAWATRMLCTASGPIHVFGDHPKRWRFTTSVIDRVHLTLTNNNQPLKAQVNLWQGSDHVAQKLSFHSENGGEYSFQAIIETPRDDNTLVIQNEVAGASPLVANVDAELKDGRVGIENRQESLHASTLQLARSSNAIHEDIPGGGTIRTFSLDASTTSARIMLSTNGSSLHAKIEILCGPNNSKQIIEVSADNGRDNPLYTMIEMPQEPCVLQIVNIAAAVELPLMVHLEPYIDDDYYYYDVTEEKSRCMSGTFLEQYFVPPKTTYDGYRSRRAHDNNKQSSRLAFDNPNNPYSLPGPSSPYCRMFGPP